MRYAILIAFAAFIIDGCATSPQSEAERARAIQAKVAECIKSGGDPTRDWKNGERDVVCHPAQPARGPEVTKH